MNLKEALLENSELLSLEGIEEARLEAEVLLRQVFGLNKAELYVHLEDELPPGQMEGLNQLIQRRLSHEPIAYITGHKEFFGLDFHVNHNTLIPRPETELLVEQALKLGRDRHSLMIADIGTGCGAIAIALAAHLPQAQVYAIDISASALEIASLNSKINRVDSRVHPMRGNLLQPLSQPVHLIVANLPYISDTKMGELPKEILLFEPKLALSGGPDGLQHISQLLTQAKDKLCARGAILLEISPEQNATVIDLARQYFPRDKAKTIFDLNGQERVIIIESNT